MFLQHVLGVMYNPNQEWKQIEKEGYSASQVFMKQIAVLALIPAVSLFIGTTQVGWSVAGGEYVQLAVESALPAAVLFYFAMAVAVGVIAYSIYWMEKTYGGKASLDNCLTLTAFTATPMFLVGLTGLFPMLWFNVGAGMLAVSYSIYLLFKGVPQIMHIPEERAFMFTVSILTVGLCVLVGLIVSSVILWNTLVPLTFVAA